MSSLRQQQQNGTTTPNKASSKKNNSATGRFRHDPYSHDGYVPVAQAECATNSVEIFGLASPCYSPAPATTASAPCPTLPLLNFFSPQSFVGACSAPTSSNASTPHTPSTHGGSSTGSSTPTAFNNSLAGYSMSLYQADTVVSGAGCLSSSFAPPSALSMAPQYPQQQQPQMLPQQPQQPQSQPVTTVIDLTTLDTNQSSWVSYPIPNLTSSRTAKNHWVELCVGQVPFFVTGDMVGALLKKVCPSADFYRCMIQYDTNNPNRSKGLCFVIMKDVDNGETARNVIEMLHQRVWFNDDKRTATVALNADAESALALLSRRRAAVQFKGASLPMGTMTVAWSRHRANNKYRQQTQRHQQKKPAQQQQSPNKKEPQQQYPMMCVC